MIADYRYSLPKDGINPSFYCRSLVIALCLSLAAGSVLSQLKEQQSGIAEGEAYRFYVSPAGNDTFSGRRPATTKDKSDGPFLTIERAQEAIRELKQDKVLMKPIVVYLREGTYELEQPLRFTPLDSGTAQFPITYTAYPGERAVISGGTVIKGWEPVEGSLWRAPLPVEAQGEVSPRQLFVDGSRAVRAREPDDGYFFFEDIVDPNRPKDKLNRLAFKFREGQLQAKGTALKSVEVVKFFGWNEARRPIERIDEENRIVYLQAPVTKRADRPLNWYGKRFYLENLREGLDEPGEWYYDEDKANLLYYPEQGQNPKEATFVVPRLTHLVIFEGIPSKHYVEYIVLRNLVFAHASAGVSRKGYAEWQSNIFAPAAISAQGVRHIIFRDNEVTHIGPYGIEIGASSNHNQIIANYFHDLGGGGIKIGPRRASENPVEHSTHNLVADNRVKNGSHIYLAAAGIWVGDSAYNQVLHNEVTALAGMGISVGWHWHDKPTATHHNEVAYNHIHHIGRRLLGSGSGIYTLGRQPGTVIHHNLVHDVTRYRGIADEEGKRMSHPAFGLQVDNGSSEITFENNIVYNVPDAAYKQLGNQLVVRNNIFAFAEDYLIQRRKDQGPMTFSRNIVYADNGRIFGDQWSKKNAVIDHNLYFSTKQPLVFVNQNFSKWQELGRDDHSLVLDPRFTDPKAGDFYLPTDSPAFDIGFDPIDLSTVGPRTNDFDK